jgi:hypothetical protein
MMKRIWRIAFLILLTACSLPLTAARNSQGFNLPVDVQVGDLRIPQGQYNVAWTEASGSRVQLTLKAEGKKPITIPARLIAEKHAEAGITTFDENGRTYLQDFHTKDQTFILSGTAGASQ